MVRSPELSIIVPTWNNLDYLRLCVDSLARHTSHSYQLVLHVNDGSDGSLEWVRAQGIEHTWTTQNVGICRAVNQAADQCRGEYLVYLNDDMYVLPGWDRPLVEALSRFGDREMCYVSGTMVQAAPISPAAVTADYGARPSQFDERKLLDDHASGRLAYPDWCGATWPPSCIHRKWWDLAGGYSEALSPGFYSDIDFSRKLWALGCRQFWGLGASLVYHFSERTTSQVRGPRKQAVHSARTHFLRQWGVTPSMFTRYYLRAGQPLAGALPELTWYDSALLRLRSGAAQAGELAATAASRWMRRCA
jgi:glycosyltransferase involved in cell wall biosynthesis